MYKTQRTVMAFLALVAFISFGQTVKADEYDETSVRIAYNMNVIGRGISGYYSFNRALPASLAQLIEEGWVPRGLLNPYTGGMIAEDSMDGEIGGYAILPVGQSAVELVFYKADVPMVSTYDIEHLSGNTAGLSEERYLAGLYVSWAKQCLQAYERVTGEIPQSIADLEGMDFWPFAGLANLYSGAPMRFDSLDVGDMYWEFTGESVVFRIWLDPRPGAIRSGMGFQYPL